MKSSEKKIITSRYEVIDVLGSGNLATSYLVRDVRTRSRYVLKLYDKIDSYEFYASIDAETMEQLVSIKHKHINKIIDFGNHNNHIFFVREVYSFESLDKLDISEISKDQLYSIIIQILQAINFLYSVNITDLNLKLSNILFKYTKEDKIEIKITDYLNVGSENTYKVLKESFFYKSPETLKKNYNNLKSNFYSLGVILYKMITSVFPYTVSDISSFNENGSIRILKFPKEFIDIVPQNLIDLTLKLLSLNPKDRYSSIEEIVDKLNESYINLFTPSLEEYIKQHNYYVNEDTSHDLLSLGENVVEKDSDKIVVLYGQRGIKKDHAISLFRYHILNDKYNIFDYKCSPKHKDPFFALAKELYNSGLIDSQKWETRQKDASEHFKKFITRSENDINDLKEKPEELKLDFHVVYDFLYFVAEKKPLIFIVRNAEYMMPETVEFLNYILAANYKNGKLVDNPILIILSTNNINSLDHLSRTFVSYVHAKPMTFDDSKKYVSHLLKNNFPPKEVMEIIWDMTHGNPQYIFDVISDMINNGLIKENSNEILFGELNSYKSPQKVVEEIKYRLGNLSHIFKENLIKLSWLNCNFTRELYFSIIPDDLSFFGMMGKNDFIEELPDFYYRIVPKIIISLLKKQISEKDKYIISEKLFEFYLKNNLKLHINTLIRHIAYVKDYSLKKKVVQKFSDNIIIAEKNLNLYVESLFTILEFLQNEPENKDDDIFFTMIFNYQHLYDKKLDEKIKKFVEDMVDETPFKLIIKGLYYFKRDQYSKAISFFDKAIKNSKTKTFQIVANLYLYTAYSKIGGNKKNKNNLYDIKIIDNNFIFYDLLELWLTKMKVLDFMEKGEQSEALKLTEKAISEIPSLSNHLILFLLADFYNIKAVIYSDKKLIDKAIGEFNKSLNIWKEYNEIYGIMLLNNNLADSYLLNGIPEKAFSYLRNLLGKCSEGYCFSLRIQTLVNISESNIKIGNYEMAETVLNDALASYKYIETKPFYSTILNNLAIIKIKKKNFYDYLAFMEQYFSGILKGEFDEIIPPVKTFFYFLNQVGDYTKIEHLLTKYKTMFEKSGEKEFYFQARSFIILHELRRGTANQLINEEAIEIINKTLESSQNIQSRYAETISKIRLAEYYLIKKKYKEANNIINQAEKNTEEYNYHYWNYQVKLIKAELDIQNPKIPFKKILHDLIDIREYLSENVFYYSEIQALSMIVRIMHSIGETVRTKKFFDIYVSKVNKATSKIDERYQKLFKRKFPVSYHSFLKKKSFATPPREKRDINDFRVKVFNLLKLYKSDKVKVLLKEYIKETVYVNHMLILKINKPYFYLEEYLNDNFDYDYSKLMDKIEEAKETFSLKSIKKDKYNFYIIPIGIKGIIYGFLIIYDNYELPLLTDEELDFLDILRVELYSFLVSIEKMKAVEEKEEKINNIFEAFQDFISNTTIEKLEADILKILLQYFGAKRGFIFKKDMEKNHMFADGLDNEGHTNIDSAIIEKMETASEDYFLNNHKIGNILAIKINLPKFDYKAVYYFDTYSMGAYRGRISFEKENLKILLNLIETSIKIVYQNTMIRDFKYKISIFENEKVKFLKLINHELNTPQTKIDMALQELLMNHSELKNSESIALIKNSLKQMHNLITIMNKYHFYKEQFNPNYDVCDIANLIKNLIKEKNISAINSIRKLDIVEEISKNIPQTIKMDCNAVMDILSIFVDNSIRFSPDNSRIIVGARLPLLEKEKLSSKKTIVLYVSDQGKGIKEQERDNIFKIFYEGGDINSHKSGTLGYLSGGLGLGLALAKQIVDSLGGSIKFESEPNLKTSFYALLPIKSSKK